MENRDRDKTSRSEHSTNAGDVNRKTSSRKGQSQSDSEASFGQNIGRSENLSEPSRRSGSEESSGLNSSGGRSSGSSSGMTGGMKGSSERVSGSRRSVEDDSSIDSGRKDRGSMNSSSKDDSHSGRH